MHNPVKVTSDMYWVGASDRRLALFENVFPIPKGVSYNSYLVLDEKTVLLDATDRAVSGQMLENISYLLNGRALDYLIVNHMEPDHAASMGELVLRYPGMQIVCNAKALAMIRNYFDFDIDSRVMVVKEGDTLNTGRHSFSFLMAPMVHWPEVMVTYDAADRVLYSADAFGTFGALNGNIFADEVNFEGEWLAEARRYYTNIVGKYGNQVQALLKKASALQIDLLCPLHGPIWRADIAWFVEKYSRWSAYMPEEQAVMIAYASVYGGTENAANILAAKLAEKGIRNIAMYDVSSTHPSVIVSEAFRCSHLVFAATTYNAGIFCNMETALLDIKAHNLQNRTVAIIENGSWAPTAGCLMRELFVGMKGMTILEESVRILSSLKPTQMDQLEALAEAIFQSIPCSARSGGCPSTQETIEPAALFNLSYGLFVLSAQADKKDNGCIINTVTQVTDTPKRISIAVNKSNLTHDLVLASGQFNVSILAEDAPFQVFKDFGFCSGRTVDKFRDAPVARSSNGLYYLTKYTNGFISARVLQSIDLGTHTVFIAEVTEAKILRDIPSVTYAYYHAHIKPKPPVAGPKKKGFVCKICGYVYEGDTLPADFICPLCKHGADDFEPLGA